jgi:hypothetical protein
MFIRKHKGCIWTVKAVLTVICLSLFVAQASYKFYQLSSAEPVTARLVMAKAGTCPAAFGSFSRRARDGREFQTLDKRFDQSSFFLLPFPIAGIAPVFREGCACATRSPMMAAGRSPGTPFLRGPPSSAR